MIPAVSYVSGVKYVLRARSFVFSRCRVEFHGIGSSWCRGIPLIPDGRMKMGLEREKSLVSSSGSARHGRVECVDI